ncbi:hypothetical protein ACFQZ4_50425 [Catellatospora coxensis]
MQPAATVHGARSRAELVLIQASCTLRAIQLSVGLPVLLFGGLDDFHSVTLVVEATCRRSSGRPCCSP